MSRDMLHLYLLRIAMQTEQFEHPGVVVRQLLEEAGLSVTDAAHRLDVSRSQLSRLLGQQSGISPEMALRLATVFGVDAREYLDRQTAFDLARVQKDLTREIKKLKRYRGNLRRRNKEYVLNTLRGHENMLREKGLNNLYLFGSVARGQATAKSDIDLYFDDRTGKSLGLLEIGEIEDQITELLGVKADLVAASGLKPHIRQKIKNDEIRVF